MGAQKLWEARGLGPRFHQGHKGLAGFSCGNSPNNSRNKNVGIKNCLAILEIHETKHAFNSFSWLHQNIFPAVITFANERCSHLSVWEEIKPTRAIGHEINVIFATHYLGEHKWFATIATQIRRKMNASGRASFFIQVEMRRNI